MKYDEALTTFAFHFNILRPYILGSYPTLRDFDLGWVDCTPAKMTAFCG